MKTLKVITIAMGFAALYFVAPQSHAQIHVATDGDVGIGTTGPSAKLDIYTTGTSTYRGLENYNYYSGSSWKYGLYNYVSDDGTSGRYGLYSRTYSPSGNSSTHYGTYNYSAVRTSSTGYGLYNYTSSYEGNGTRYGLYNYMWCSSSTDGTGNRYALYSGVSGACDGGTSYAGYFAGNVYVSGTVTSTSDESKKKDVTSLESAVGILAQLSPKTYNYIDDGNLNLPSEKQYGFLAQDLEEVLPELVKEVDVFGEPVEDEEGNFGDPAELGTIKSVNYQALIPILVKAVQEQQAEIDALKAELAKK